MSDLPKSITINEEGPREGFQFEKHHIPTARKIELVDALSETGLKNIQVGSFVPAKNVPGMADVGEVVNGFKKRDGVRYYGLWMNDKGLIRALESRDRLTIEGKISLTASEPFLLRNQKRTMAQNIESQHRILDLYREHNVPVDSASIMAVFGCNYAGDIPVQSIVDITKLMIDMGAEHGYRIEHISLADTMAWATPLSIKRVLGTLRETFPDLTYALHLHDTRGMGIANAYAGLEMGVTTFDAAAGGLGGCPFASHKGAAGNVCTEDLVFMCDEMGIETGVDLDKLIEAARLAEDIVGHPLPGSIKMGGNLKTLRAQLQ